MAQTTYYKWTIGNAGAKITASEINTIINNMYNVRLPAKGFSATKPNLITQNTPIKPFHIKPIYDNLPSAIKTILGGTTFSNLYFGTNGYFVQGKTIYATQIFSFFNSIDTAIYNSQFTITIEKYVGDPTLEQVHANTRIWYDVWINYTERVIRANDNGGSIEGSYVQSCNGDKIIDYSTETETVLTLNAGTPVLLQFSNKPEHLWQQIDVTIYKNNIRIGELSDPGSEYPSDVYEINSLDGNYRFEITNDYSDSTLDN